jgi:uncharacterized protein YqgV (UPF0045/DUF77 family)
VNVQAEVSLYPLRTAAVGACIEEFIRDLEQSRLSVRPGSMSTRIIGELGDVFSVLADAFAHASQQHQVVLVVKASNACPGGDDSCAPDGTEDMSSCPHS